MITSLYLHVPFCAKICHYCDFAKTANFNDQLVDRYFTSLHQHLKLWCQYLSPRLQTVYIGGGTPSLFADHYRPVFDCLALYLSDNCEITLEANPNDLDCQRLAIWRELGINRLSIGIQTFNDEYLKKFLQRTHSAKQAIDAVFLAQKFFSNISIDLIYGLPRQKVSDLEDDLTIACSLPVNHLSCYNLIYEQRTPIGRAHRRGKLQSLDENIEADMYGLICTRLANSGFDHYEISNWTKDKYSHHNQSYWQDKGYLAVGSGAHGYFPAVDGAGIRYSYYRSERKFAKDMPLINKTLAVDQLLLHLGASIDKNRDCDSWLLEYLATSLRTSQGVDLKLIKQKTGRQLVVNGEVQQVLTDGVMAIDGEVIRLSNREWFRENYWVHLLYNKFSLVG